MQYYRQLDAAERLLQRVLAPYPSLRGRDWSSWEHLDRPEKVLTGPAPLDEAICSSR